MKMLRTRTKFEAVAVGLFLVVLSIMSALATYRTITSSSDTYVTFIRTSSGNMYNATWANLRTAYYSLNATSGGTLYLPIGTFYSTGTLQLTNNTRIIGSGIGRTIIKAASGDAATWMFAARRTGGVGPFNNISICDLTLDGNTTSGNCLYAVQTTDLFIQNVECRKPNTNGMGIWSCKRAIVDNCIVHDIDDASYEPYAINTCNESTFSNLLAYNSVNWLYDFHTCNRCVITNINGYNSVYGIKFFGDVGEKGGNNTVSNVNLNNSFSGAGSGVWIKREHHSDFSNININHGAGTGTAFVIDASDYLNLNNIIIQNVPVIGLKIDDAIADCHHININNMMIMNTLGSGLNIDEGHNISISNSQIKANGNYNTITSGKNICLNSVNFMANTASYGLYINGGSLISVSGCTLGYNAGANLCISSATQLSFDNCVFSYSGSNGITGAACDFFTVSDSKFISNVADGFDDVSSPCDNFTFIGCQFLSNVKGMDMGANSNVSILGCLFNGNTGVGIKADTLDSIIIKDCIMWNDAFEDNIVGSHNLTGSAYNIGMTIV